jgi:hypothetical protein
MGMSGIISTARDEMRRAPQTEAEKPLAALGGSVAQTVFL